MMESLVDATGYAVSCSNQAALDWFNKGLVAFVSLYGNSMTFFNKALEVDSDFLLPHCVLTMFWLDSLEAPNHPKVAVHLEAIEKALTKNNFNEREASYIRAAKHFASGDLIKCTDEFMAMLRDYPLDTLGLRFVAGNTITIGDYEKARDTFAWTLAFWTKDMEFYPNILAFYAFALEETNEREKAEKLLKKILSMNPKIPWAHHAMTHVLEESHDARDGVDFLTQTRSDWEKSVFGGHITWHLTLHYFDMGDNDALLSEYDNTLSKNVSAGNLFGLLDATSILWRLNVMGIDIGEERLSKVTDALAHHAHNHRSPWFDTHIMMGLANGKVKQAAARLKLAQEMLQSLKTYPENEFPINQSLSEKLGVPVCTALLAYGQERYDEVLQIMLPLRYNFRQFGGSWAQRQVFNLTLIQAAIKADNVSVAKGLIAELRAQKPKSKRLQEILKKL